MNLLPIATILQDIHQEASGLCDSLDDREESRRQALLKKWHDADRVGLDSGMFFESIVEVINKNSAMYYALMQSNPAEFGIQLAAAANEYRESMARHMSQY